MSVNAEMQHPEWRKTSSTGKAHLRQQGAVGMKAWCGLDLSSSTEGYFEERCKPCVAAVQSFVDEVLIDPPTTVVEEFVVRVTRPATSAPFDETLERKFRALTTWNVQVRPL